MYCSSDVVVTESYWKYVESLSQSAKSLHVWNPNIYSYKICVYEGSATEHCFALRYDVL